MNDRVLYYLFVNICPIPNIQLLHIDIIKQVFILERIDCSKGLFSHRQCLHEIIWQRTQMVIIIALNGPCQFFSTIFFFRTPYYIENSFLNILYFCKDSPMMRKTYGKKALKGKSVCFGTSGFQIAVSVLEPADSNLTISFFSTVSAISKFSSRKDHSS